jgi:hypothetical protein
MTKVDHVNTVQSQLVPQKDFVVQDAQQAR